MERAARGRLLIRQGDVVLEEGRIADVTAFLDASALTGESRPARLGPGGDARRGATNAGEAFALIAPRPATESTYAGIVRRIEAAQGLRGGRRAIRRALVGPGGGAWWWCPPAR